jgi:hypothetical protein
MRRARARAAGAGREPTGDVRLSPPGKTLPRDVTSPNPPKGGNQNHRGSTRGRPPFRMPAFVSPNPNSTKRKRSTPRRRDRDVNGILGLSARIQLGKNDQAARSEHIPSLGDNP